MKKYVLLATVILILLTGCTSTRSGGENLSSAMNKSRSSNSEDRSVDDGEESNFFVDLFCGIFFSGSGDTTVSISNSDSEEHNRRHREYENREIKSEPWEEPNLILSAGHGRSFYTGDDIDEIESVNLSLKLATPDQAAEFAASLQLGSYTLKNNFEYKDAITPGIVAGFEIKGKGNIGKLSENWRVNAGAGMSWNYLTWDYKNPLYSNTYVITDDNIQFMRMFALMGIDYRKRDSIYLNFETYPEVILTAEDTRGGFRNDVFKNHFGIGYRIEVGKTF